MMIGNTILLKSERITLPEKLQQKAIEIACKGSHPGKSQMERQLRSHFFFHDMQAKVINYVNTCIDCKIFEDKKTVKPLVQHKVQTKMCHKAHITKINLENYDDFAKHIEEHSDFERPFLFQDSCFAPTEPDQVSRHQEIDDMMSCMENQAFINYNFLYTKFCTCKTILGAHPAHGKPCP